MSRWYGEAVVVRPAEVGVSHGPDFRPGAFLWRGRVYVVRDVLGHWRERRAWWAGSAAQVLHGDVDPAADLEGSDPRSQGAAKVPPTGTRPGPATTTSGGAHTSTVALDLEREIWRVEASRGRMFGPGVFDLCRDSVSADEWRLLHVDD